MAHIGLRYLFKIRFLAILIAALGVFNAVQVAAHHSVSGQFDVSQKVEVTGKVVKVDWVNPHIYVHLEVIDENGEKTMWRIGSVPVAMARKAGITKKSLMGNGDIVKITAYPARDGTKGLGFMTRVDYADGTFVSVSPDRL